MSNRLTQQARVLTMDPTRAARRLCNIAVALAVTLGAAMLLSGCITVPAGYQPATVNNAAIIDIVADDQAALAAEQAPFFAGLKDAERTRLFGEMFDAVAEDISNTSDTLTLKPAFVSYGKSVDVKVRKYDEPLDTWLARIAENERRLRDASANERATLEAMKAAQTTVEGSNGTPR